MGNYSKLVGALVGNLVGILLVWAAMKGFGNCTTGLGMSGEQTCSLSVLGLSFTQTQITAAVMTALNMVFVHQFPANKPA